MSGRLKKALTLFGLFVFFFQVSPPVPENLLPDGIYAGSSAFAKSRRKKHIRKKVEQEPEPQDSEEQENAVPVEVLAADNLMRKGAFNDAEILYSQALKANDQSIPARLGYGMALAKQFKLQAARTQFKKVLELESKNAMAHSGLAIVLYNSLSNPEIRAKHAEVLKEAEDECKNGLAIDPNMPVAHATLGDIYRSQGKLDEARQNYQKAVDLDPEYSEALSGLGLVQIEKGKLDEAEVTFNKAVAVNPNNSTAHYGLGKSYLAGGRYEEALKELNTSLEQHSKSAPAYLARGQVQLSLGDLDAALADFEKAISISPDMTEAYIGVASVKENNSDLKGAIEKLQAALARLERSVELRLLIAEMNLKLEKADEAIDVYSRILNEKDSENIDACHGLARAFYIKFANDPQGKFSKSEQFKNGKELINKAYDKNNDNTRLKLCKLTIDTIDGGSSDLKPLADDADLKERIAFVEALLTQAKYHRAGKELSGEIEKSKDIKSLLALGDSALFVKDLDNAEAAFKKIRSQPDSKYLEKRLDRAFDRIKRAREISKQKAQDAAKSVEEKEIDQAIADYRLAIKHNPRAPVARQGLAEALEKAKPYLSSNFLESAKQYRAYVSLSPDLSKKDLKKMNSKIEKLIKKGEKLKQKEEKNAQKKKKSKGKKKSKKKKKK